MGIAADSLVFIYGILSPLPKKKISGNDSESGVAYKSWQREGRNRLYMKHFEEYPHLHVSKSKCFFP